MTRCFHNDTFYLALYWEGTLRPLVIRQEAFLAYNTMLKTGTATCSHQGDPAEIVSRRNLLELQDGSFELRGPKHVQMLLKRPRLPILLDKILEGSRHNRMLFLLCHLID